jgi:hypothetical protein
MKQLLKPVWVYVTVAIPAAVLFFLYGSAFQVIRSLLDKGVMTAWISFGSVLLALTLSFCGYAMYCQLKRKTLDPRFGFFLVAGFVAFIYVFLFNSTKIIPLNVPQWMLYEGDLILYVFTFFMPGIAYGLLLCVMWFTPEGKDYKTPVNIIFLVAIPVSWYIAFHVLMPAFSNLHNTVILEHSALILFISSTLVFLFFLVRIFYLVIIHRDFTEKGILLLVQIPFLIILPVLCFVINNTQGSLTGGLFGDFSNPAYYVYAVVNGILFIIPDFSNKAGRLFLLFLRSLTYPLVIYFFCVLLPFFPLSIVAILAIGFGFLMLTPIVVMILATYRILNDFRFLSGHYHKAVAVMVFLIGFAVIPATVAGKFSYDKSNLRKALDYLYASDYSSLSSEGINVQRFIKTMDAIKANKQMQGRRPVKRKPYISPFFEWFVLDNLTLSEKKLRQIDLVFTDTSDIKTEGSRRERLSRPAAFPPKCVSLRTEETDTSSSHASTWIHMEIENGPTDTTEYSTSFTVPEGCWISDYYLEINGKREYGILAEKKTATWVYQQITTRERRDPGILFYSEGNNRLTLRIFPFASKEKRKTGFRIEHIEPCSFTVDGIKALSALPKITPSNPIAAEGQLGWAIPAAYKSTLPLVSRQPYYHFIIDCSKSTLDQTDEYIGKIDEFLKNNGHMKKPVFTLMNYTGKTVVQENWKEELKKYPKEGGFFLEKALKAIVLQLMDEKDNTYPVPVVVTDDIENAVILGDFSGFHTLIPELGQFVVLNTKGTVTARTFERPNAVAQFTGINASPTRIWSGTGGNSAYLPDDGKMSIVPTISTKPVTVALSGKDKWNTGLAINLMEMNLAIFPRDLDRKWLAIIKAGFASNILSRQTTFIVLENEAQKLALIKKQKTVLDSKKALDIGEEHRMSEPPIIYLLMALFFYFLWRQRRRAHHG